MKYIVVYSSQTGNTKQVGEAICQGLPEGTPCVSVKEAPADLASYDVVFAGFWADRGTANKEAKNFIEGLQNDKVALFATLGVPPQMPHATETMEAASALLPDGKKPIGTFHCQGKVDPKVIEMMYKMFPAGHSHGPSKERNERHAMAASHPDANDLAKATAFAKSIVEQVEG